MGGSTTARSSSCSSSLPPPAPLPLPLVLRLPRRLFASPSPLPAAALNRKADLRKTRAEKTGLSEEEQVGQLCVGLLLVVHVVVHVVHGA